MKTMQFEVRQIVTVSVDETKFTPEFMEEFREGFYPFKTIEDHGKHLAQMSARGIIPDLITAEHGEFIEGYGPSGEMGIAVHVLPRSTEVLGAND